jgi:hypothetical protein
LAVGTFGVGPAVAAGNCENVTQYGALASASGARSAIAAPNLTLGGVATEENPADLGLPTAQAQIDSIQGSKGFAGAPYSATVADNAGAGGADASQVPTFAIAQDPSTPESTKTLPAGTISAKASPDSSSGDAVLGASASPGAGVASTSNTAKASCEEDTTVQAVADSAATGIDIAGVLKIGSVRSHAKAVVSPSGEKTVEGTVDIDGASVAGHGVTISDKGVVLAGSPAPLAKDPITPALEAAGISVKYIGGVADEATGQVLAPTLEISVARTVPGPSGDVPARVTLSFGRAFARAVLEGSEGAFGASEDLGIDDLSSFADESFEDFPTTDVGSLDTPTEASTETNDSPSSSTGDRAANVATARLADWSIAPGYSAMGVGALLLLVAWIGLERIAVRLRWR